MKKFYRILICLLLCVFSINFVACGDERSPEEKAFTYPSSADSITGNGGLAVQKGNYLYYVNGYKSILGTDRTQDDVYTHGSLMLMKLNSDGSVVTDENGLLKDDYYITMSNRLCGFEATSLYIAGDYLYFTAASVENTEDVVDPAWAKEFVEFYRIKLDKTSEPERIYQAGVKYSTDSAVDFEYYSSGDNVFILIYEPGKNIVDQAKFEDEKIEEDEVKENALIRVTGNGDVNLVANNVDDYILSDNSNEIFYKTTDDADHILTKYDVVSNASSNYVTKNSTFTVDFVSQGNVYITQDGALYASNIATNSAFTCVSYSLGDKVSYVVDNGVVMLIRDNEFNFLNENLAIIETIKDNDVTSINVIGCVNGCVVYYADDNKTIKSFSYGAESRNQVNAIKALATVEGLDTSYFDLQEDYVYFYKTAEGKSNKYLHRVKIANNFGETAEMVGVYLEEDAPEIEEDEIIEE